MQMISTAIQPFIVFLLELIYRTLSLQVPYANFSLAVVIETSNANQYELKGGIKSQNSMIYHRIDKIGRGPQYPLCRSTQYFMLSGGLTFSVSSITVIACMKL